jgi:hypothetical protein
VLTAVPSSAPSKQMEHVRSLSTVSSRLRACVSSSRVDASASFAAALAASSASTYEDDEGQSVSFWSRAAWSEGRTSLAAHLPSRKGTWCSNGDDRMTASTTAVDVQIANKTSTISSQVIGGRHACKQVRTTKVNCK